MTAQLQKKKKTVSTFPIEAVKPVVRGGIKIEIGALYYTPFESGALMERFMNSKPKVNSIVASGDKGPENAYAYPELPSSRR